jgi:hypothetical protein
MLTIKPKKKIIIISNGLFLRFKSYKSFEQKIIFQFTKKEVSFQKKKTIILLTYHIFNK